MPLNVRAAVAHAPHQPLTIETVQLEGPGFGEVLVQFKATGLCHSDLHVLDGTRSMTFPLILGHEGAGIVVECGAGVTSVKPGDHVVPFAVPECRQCSYCASPLTNLCNQFFKPPQGARFSLDGRPVTPFVNLATFAEYSVIREVYLAKIREDAPLDKVCCIGCGVTTGFGAVLFSAKVTPGATVAVFGLGGIGLSAVQGARMAGAVKIIGVDTNPGKEGIGRQLGMTHYLNPASGNMNVVQEIIKLTDGGVDFSFECVGNTSLMRQALESCHPGWGTATIVGLAPDGQDLTIPPGNFTRGRRLIGSCMGGVRGRTDLPKFIDWYMDGHVRVDEIISHVLPLDRINEGFDMMRNGSSIRTVVVF